jgi:hypothetical protein
LKGPAPFPAFRLFLTCWLIYGIHWAPWVIREQFPAITLAMAGTLDVERFHGWSSDIFAGPRGGAFINNNPGASIVGAIPLFVLRPALASLERWNDTLPASIARSRSPAFADRPAVRARREWYFLAVAFLTGAGLMAPISALAMTALAIALWSGGIPRTTAISASLVCGFATPIFFRTGYLNHNLLVGHAALLGVLLLRNRALPPGRRAVAAGLLGGFAVLCDYSGLVVFAMLGWVSVHSTDTVWPLRDRLRRAALYIAGATPPLLGLIAYQLWAFGHSALPSQHFMPGIEPTTYGYRGFSWPSLEIAWMNFFDRRFGLFVACPLLTLGLLAPFVKAGRFRLPARETRLILTFFGAFVLFCAANQYARLQYTTGVRYLVPVIPGLTLLSLQVLQALPAVTRCMILLPNFAIAWPMAFRQQGSILQIAREFTPQFSWTERMSEYGGTDHPVAVSAAVLLLAGVLVALIWRKPLSAGR